MHIFTSPIFIFPIYYQTNKKCFTEILNSMSSVNEKLIFILNCKMNRTRNINCFTFLNTFYALLKSFSESLCRRNRKPRGVLFCVAELYPSSHDRSEYFLAYAIYGKKKLYTPCTFSSLYFHYFVFYFIIINILY